MRSLNSYKKTQKHKNGKSKKQFNQHAKRHKKYQLTVVWQRFFLSTISFILLFLFLDQGSKEISSEQIKVQGSTALDSEEIVKATENFFPRKLIEINPKHLEFLLLNELPIKAISVHKRILPPEVHINILERNPIAFAQRASKQGREKGFVDIDGYWIPSKMYQQDKNQEINLLVEGWKESQKKQISLLLRNKNNLGSALRKIIINPNGEISIETQNFQSVLFGSNPDLLQEQIQALRLLNKSLPDLLINTNVKMIDIRNPSKPELKTVKIPNQTGINP